MEIFTLVTQNRLDELKEQVFNVNAVDEKKKSLLFLACIHGNDEMVNYLLSLGANPNIADKYEETPMFDLARKAKIELAKTLILNNAKLNIFNRAGETPLHLAARKGDLNFVKLLVESGANVRSRTQVGLLPIHLAILSGSLEVFTYLFEKTSIPYTCVDDNGDSFLHFAARQTNIDITKYLLDKDLDPNRLNVYLETPLFEAARNGDRDVVLLLLSYGAIIEVKNRRFETVLDVSSKEIYDLLIDYQETPKYKDSLDKNAYTLCVLNRDFGTLKQLVDSKKALSKDRNGKSALDYAKEYQLKAYENLLKTL